MSAGVEIRRVTEQAMTMGERPTWDVDTHRLYWIDVYGACLYSSTVDGRELQRYAFPEQFVSSLALRRDGRTMVASHDRLYAFDLGTGEVEKLFDAGLGPDCGFNDGAVDAQGRFITGMADMGLINALTSGADLDAQPTIRLFRMDQDHSVHSIADPIGVTNGPCFPADGKTLYCNDSFTRTVYAWDYDPATGSATNRRVVTQFTDGAIPDGTTVDDQGYLWIACYEAGEVRRIAPDGSVDRTITVPVASPTAVIFAGPDLDVLVVTSRGEESGTGEDGRVLTLHGVGAAGLPQHKFG